MALEIAKYLALFVAEASEHLAGSASELVAPRAAAARTARRWRPPSTALFRHAHSVKGMAASMELEGIAALAHRGGGPRRRSSGRTRPGARRRRAWTSCSPRATRCGAMVQARRGGRVGPTPTRRSSSGSPPRRDACGGRRGPARARRAAPRPPRPPRRPSRRRRAAGHAPPSVQVEVEIAGSCPVPAVRGFLVVKKLWRLGAARRAPTPAVEDLKAGRIPRQEARASSSRPREPLQAVERALAQISDLAARRGPRGEPRAAAPAAPRRAAAPRRPRAAGGRAAPSASAPSCSTASSTRWAS